MPLISYFIPKPSTAEYIAKYPVPGNRTHAFKSLIIVLLASKLLLFKPHFLHLLNSEDKVMDLFFFGEDYVI